MVENEQTPEVVWGPQTRLAITNFPISGRPVDPRLLRALARIKAAAAMVNGALAEVPGVDPAMGRVIAEVAKNISELKGHAEVDGIILSMRRGWTEDVQAYQTDDRGDSVTIQRQFLEGPVARSREIHFDAFDEFVEIGFGNGKLFDVMRQTNHERPRRSSAIDELELASPATKFFLGIAAGWRFIDGAVHCFAKGVHRIHGVPPSLWEKEKRVIEVASTLLREIGAKRLCFCCCHRHRDNPRRASDPLTSRTMGELQPAATAPEIMSPSNSTPSTRRGPGRLKYELASTM